MEGELVEGKSLIIEAHLKVHHFLIWKDKLGQTIKKINKRYVLIELIVVYLIVITEK